MGCVSSDFCESSEIQKVGFATIKYSVGSVDRGMRHSWVQENSHSNKTLSSQT